MTPSSSEHDRLLDHSYDGIEEFDNPMPRWWVWIFWATIVFSLLYIVDIGGFMKGPGRIADYNRSIAEAEKRFPKSTGPANAAVLAALAKDQKAIALGKTVFSTNCAVCHRADGGGNIGPNLTDEFWLHGGSLAEINKTIA